MTYTELETTIAETKRFLEKAERLRAEYADRPENRKWYLIDTPVLQGEVRRASMDLTRQLARLRKP